jgi:hypothetical protein
VVQPARQSASEQGSTSLLALPSLAPQTRLSEPELALRLLLALAHSAAPALAAAGLAAVLHRHGMHAAGRAAPGGSGATHVHVLPFGVTARAIGVLMPVGSSYGYSGELDARSVGSLLPNKGPSDRSAVCSAGHCDGHGASVLTRLHLHTAARALSAGCVGGAGAKRCSDYALHATAGTAQGGTASANPTLAACATSTPSMVPAASATVRPA